MSSEAYIKHETAYEAGTLTMDINMDNLSTALCAEDYLADKIMAMAKNTLNVWGCGQIMAYSGIDGETDFDNGIVMRTSFVDFGFDIRLPLNGGNICFASNAVANNEFVMAGDFFIANGYKLVFIDAWHLLLEGDFTVSPGESVQILSHGNRTLVGTKAFFRSELINLDIDEIAVSRMKILNGFPFPGHLSIQSQKTLMKAYSQLRTMFYSPAGEIKHRWTTPDRWPHRNMWLWDSVFHAIGIRHIDISLAREALLAVFDLQREDGFIPLCGAPGIATSITQPPVLALGVKMVNSVNPSREFIARLYPRLKRYIEWDMMNRDSDGGGLLEWFIEEHELCRSGESGMDNSPRFDMATQIDATDFNSFISLECEIMAEFATLLELHDEAERWSEWHKRLNKKINERLWNEKQAFYFDYDVSRNCMLDVMACSGFLPLICGAASSMQAQLLAEHLYNPKTFGTPLPVPSIAVASEKFYSKDMWRGPTWMNLNWLIAYGFRRYNMNHVADMIIEKSIREIEKMYLKYGTFFEFYDDRREVDPPNLYRKANKQPDSYHQAFHDYGWTATLYIDMILSGS